MQPRIAVLFSELSGYLRACLAALRDRHGARVLVVHWPAVGDAPFAAADTDWADAAHLKSDLSPAALRTLVEDFAPDGLLISGWMDRDYLRLARDFRRRGIPVVAGSDTPWRGSWRQHAASLAAPWLLHPAIDVLWVAGERQRSFARRLGYAGDRCLSGFYSCDWPRFAVAHHPDRPAAFLFVGRYHVDKGLPDLLEAYDRYRASSPSPWPLVCAGAGPLKPLLAGRPGVVDRGFIQPEELPNLMREAGAFILPSRYEPWGVALHEAATAGLPLLATTACGATTSLLQEGYNGFLVEPGDVPALAERLGRIAAMPAEDRETLGAHSHSLSRQFTPARWADTLLQGFRQARGIPVQPIAEVAA